MASDRLPLGTKCCVPRLPDPLIGRPRLEGLLGDGARRRVTLVSGPPGAGKTTLLASWVASGAPERTTWLSVDGQDNEPGRLAALVSTALADAGCVEPSGGRTLDATFEDIGRRAHRCVLVLDDVQELTSGAALDTLGRVLARAPEPLDIVLVSRADPAAVGLERLRLDGRLAEVRYTDLCFNRAEAAELFAAHGLTLSDSQIRTLWALVEGWAAGLRLAAAALQSEPEPASFVANAAATQAAAADYLLGEVLARQDDDVQEFLLRTSVADRLTAELAVELTGDARAGERLSDLQRRGLFLVELDDQRCYRYHSLFRALLQARLRQHDPTAIERLHRLVAVWCLDHGFTSDAEEHARAGADWPLVGRLVLRRWLVGTTEETDPFATDPLAGISPAVVMETPELALVAAAEACRWGNRKDADLYRSRLEQAPPDTGDEARAGLRATAAHLLDLGYGWTFGIDARFRAAVAAVQDLDTAEPWTPRLRQLAELAEAEVDVAAGRLDRARHTLETVTDSGEPRWHRVLAAAMLALLDATAGNVTVAEDRLAWVAVQLDARPGHPATARFAQAAVTLCAAQVGERCGVAEALASPGTSGEWSSASLRGVDRALQAATRSRAPFFVSLDAPTAQHPLAQRALVALGVLEVVDAKGRPLPLGGQAERAVAAARAQLTVSGGGGTAALTATATPPLDGGLDGVAPRHPRTAVEAAALGAIFAERRGDHAEAERLAGEALDVSAATGVRAPLLDHGRHLVGVLERIAGDDRVRAPAVLDLVDRLQHPAGRTPVEPLTGREIEVLRRLPTLMSNLEIARGLHLSINTVKTHLKSVYRKLGVDGRREAVLRGRELELL